MTISMYSASVPPIQRALTSLGNVLKKGEAFAEARKFEPAVLLQSRLAPDMFSLVRQVQSVSDNAKGGVARLAGIEVPSFPDMETTFAELQDRLARTLAFVGGVAAAQIDGSEERDVVLKFRTGDVHFTGLAYLTGFVLPNLYFHCTAAYAILRHNGVEVGKRDYLGG
jgi:uncharacterized protein